MILTGLLPSMKYTSATNGVVVQNSPACEVTELGNIGVIDGADILINGRYPEHGYAQNQQSSFVIRVMDGTGIIASRDSNVNLTEGDVVFVEKGEVYYFEGQGLRLFMASTPAWNLEQYSSAE